MNKILLTFLLVLSFGCSKSSNKNELKVAATPVPHAQILKFAQSELKKEGINLKIVEMSDYNLPNRALEEKEVDANFFQHAPFMEEQIAEFNYPIVCYAKIHLEPMGLYSTKIHSLSDLKEKDTVAIPNDPTNEYRALSLLQTEKMITFSKGKGGSATIANIRKNPKNLTFKEVDAALLTRTLQDVTLAAIPTNYILQARLNPQDALAMESTDSPYVNILVIRKGDEKDERLMALKKVMLSDNMRKYIETQYKGNIIPILKNCK